MVFIPRSTRENRELAFFMKGTEMQGSLENSGLCLNREQTYEGH